MTDILGIVKSHWIFAIYRSFVSSIADKFGPRKYNILKQSWRFQPLICRGQNIENRLYVTGFRWMCLRQWEWKTENSPRSYKNQSTPVYLALWLSSISCTQFMSCSRYTKKKIDDFICSVVCSYIIIFVWVTTNIRLIPNFTVLHHTLYVVFYIRPIASLIHCIVKPCLHYSVTKLWNFLVVTVCTLLLLQFCLINLFKGK